MFSIKTVPFEREKLSEIKGLKYGVNWPVVYVLENGKEMYVGETTGLHTRARQHIDKPDRARLQKMHIITDEEFNKSGALDIESWLIQYVSADGKYTLQNGNGGLKNHEYFNREAFKAKFENIWKRLQEIGLVKQELIDLRNSDLFKYSPFKSLSDDQYLVVQKLFSRIAHKESGTYLVSGKPGTGKTVLAMYLMKYLSQKEETKHLRIGLVVPMTSLRKTLRRVVGKIPGLRQASVIGPNQVIHEKYDVLIVDEAHRLKRRVNIMGYGAFDNVNRALGFGNEGTELDWILRSSRHQILFYDRNQSVRPSDVPEDRFTLLPAEVFELTSQLRVEGGEDYIRFVDELLSARRTHYEVRKYDFKIFDNINEMVSAIRSHDADQSCGLSRLVAGYAWRWNTRNGADFDIEIDGLKLKWNSTTEDWVNSENAVREVGCIHTIQGYDLNYAGVILGPEISYDRDTNRIVIDPEKYMDINGQHHTTSEEQLQKYVVNIYKTLLTRGIKGTYVYISDPELRKLFKESIS